jgi:hypothetical protein
VAPWIFSATYSPLLLLSLLLQLPSLVATANSKGEVIATTIANLLLLVLQSPLCVAS